MAELHTIPNGAPPAVDVAALRLECLQAMCGQLASGILGARDVLRDGAENAAVAFLVADALDRLGWIAERASAVAGKPARVAGDADGWILESDAQDLVEQIEAQSASQ